MHTLSNCPLRTFASITTTNTFPFYILALDDAALDLFLTGPNSPTAEQRTAACLALKGKTIAQVLWNDTESCLEDTTPTFNGDVIQPYVLAKDLCEGPSGKKRTRRVHACIHTITHSSSSSLPLSTTDISSPSPLSPDQDNLLLTESRLYALKDVTEIHGLAQAAQADIRMRHATQQRLLHQDQDQDQESDGSSPSSTASSSPATRMSPCSFSLSSATTTPCPSPSSPSLSAQLLSASRSSVISLNSKPSSLSNDWSGKVPHHCKSAPASPSIELPSSSSSSSLPSSSCATCSESHSSLPHTTSTTLSHHPQECSHAKTLLLLQVTRFGTVDHAFTIPQIPSTITTHLLDTCQPSEAIHALSNTSAMSYAHPDDLRLFCQGLDRTCKSLYNVFRVRWRKSGLGLALKSLEDEDDRNKGGMAQGGSSRTIEFQGDLFEEWVDPTAVPLVVSESSHRDVDNYLWTEITGVLSNSQPLLVVRPLTLVEVEEQEKLQGQLKMMHISNQQARADKKRETLHRQWKSKSKNMGLEEGRVPKQPSLSALTSLSMATSASSTRSRSSLSSTCSSVSSVSSTSDMELARSGSHFRMPGSLPPNTRCRASATANELMGMPSVLAFPTASAPWSVLTGIAVDAWNQWIIVVHAGRAQFQDWCVYILELTVEQLIESFSLGMTLIGGRTDGQQHLEPLAEYEHEHMPSHQSSSLSERLLDQEVHEEPRLSGLQRAGKVLEEYPSLSGVVQIFGNSWLGQKLRGKLEHKLNKVADQVVDWWEHEPSPPCSSDASSDSSVLDMASGSVEPISSSE